MKIVSYINYLYLSFINSYIYVCTLYFINNLLDSFTLPQLVSWVTGEEAELCPLLSFMSSALLACESAQEGSSVQLDGAHPVNTSIPLSTLMNIHAQLCGVPITWVSHGRSWAVLHLFTNWGETSKTQFLFLWNFLAYKKHEWI